MKVILLIFCIQIYYANCSTLSNYDISNELGDDRDLSISFLIEKRSISIAKSFDTELTKLGEDWLPPLKLSGNFESLEIEDETLTFKNFKTFQIIHQNHNTLLVAVSKNETLIYTVTFSLQKVFLDKNFGSQKINFLKTLDYFEVLQNDEELWIVEASKESSMLVASRINLSADQNSDYFTQAIPLNGTLYGIQLFYFNSSIHILAVYGVNLTGLKSGELPQEKLEIFSLEDDLFVVSSEREFSCGSQHEASTVLVSHNGQLYIIFNCQTVVKIYTYNGTSIGLLQEMDKTSPVLRILPYKDALTQRQFIITVTTESIEMLLLIDDQFTKWDDIKIESGSSLAAVFRFNSRLFLISINKNNFAIHGEENMSVQMAKKFTTSCHTIQKIVPLISNKQILLGMYCSENSVLDLQFVQLEYSQSEDSPVSYMPQSEQPSKRYRIEKCLDELGTKLKRQQPDIKYFLNIISKDLILTDNKDQVITNPISFHSLEVTGDITAKHFTLQPNDNFLNLTTKINYLQNKANVLSSKMNYFETQLPTLLTFETDQHIFVSIEVPKMIANYSNILSLDLLELNGIPYQDYKNKYLLLNDDQVVTTNLKFNKVITKNVGVKVLSNSNTTVSPEDLFDTKNPNQLVTGRHSFVSIDVTGDIFRINQQTPISINDIVVENIVTAHSDVTFEGIQTFNNTINAKHKLNILNLNEINYNMWRDSLLRVNTGSSNLFVSSLTVNGNSFVQGNVKASSINGIDVWALYENGVKRSSPYQVVEGPVDFHGDLGIDIMEVATVNDIDWRNILRTRDQEVTARFYFQEAVALGDLNSNSINGLDFGNDVLVSGLDQVITGQITFESDVNVTGSEGVTMDPGATINNVDPSITSSYNGDDNLEIINQELNLMGQTLEINGNVRLSHINKVKFPDFENGFWRKSLNQRIPVDVTIENAKFKNSLYASTFNGLPIEDYVLKDKEQILYGQNIFTDVFVHGNVDMAVHSKISGYDISAIRDTAININSDQLIYGDKVFDNIQVDDLFLKNGILRDVNVEQDLYGMMAFPGTLIFKEEVKADRVNLNGDMRVETINKQPANDILFPNPRSIGIIKGNIYFEDLEVVNFTVSENINGINFNKWRKQTILIQDGLLQFPNPFIVKGDIQFKRSLDIEKMNSKNYLDHVNKIAEACHGCRITGKKIFRKPIEILQDVTAHKINGINLNELKSRLLSKSSSQIIKGVYHFDGGLTSVSLKTPEISGLPIEEIVLTDDPVFKGTMNLTSDVIFQKDLISPQGWIDGCNVNELLNPPIIDASKFVRSNVSLGRLKIEGDATVAGKLYAGVHRVNVLEFLDKVVRNTEEQNIYGETTFNNEAFTNSLNVNYVNNVPIKEFIEKFSTEQVDVKMNCDLTFTDLQVNKITAGNIKASLLNGHELQKIANAAVTKNSQELIKGLKRFQGSSEIAEDLQIQQISDISFDDLVQLESLSNESVTFLKPLYINGNIKVGGLIGGTKPDVLLKPFAYSKLTDSASFPPEYHTVTVKGDLIVDSINDIQLDDVVLTSSESQLVTGIKAFMGGLHVIGDSQIDRVNGIDIDQFKQESVFGLPETSDRYSRSVSNEISTVSKFDLLHKTIYKVGNLNLENFELARSLHKKLFYITEADRISLHDVAHVNVYKIGRTNKIYATIEYSLCRSRRSCPCLATYTFKVKDSRIEETNYIKGRNIPIHLSNLRNHFYNFHSWCYDQKIETRISHFHYKGEPKTLVQTHNSTLGAIQDLVPFHSEGNIYFVVHSKLQGEGIVTLQVLNSNFASLWRTDINTRRVNMDLKKICQTWHLLIVTENSDKESSPVGSESHLYVWDEYTKKFEISATYPMASTGGINVFDNEAYMFLGQEDLLNPESSNLLHRRNLMVYKSVNCSHFKPFTSLAVSSVSSLTTFTIGRDLYLVTASESENLITTFRLLRLEGFEEVESYIVERPTSVKYLRENHNQYLVVASNREALALLKLHFKGTVINRIEK